MPSRPPSDPFMRSSEPLIWPGGAREDRRGADYYYDTRLRRDRLHVVLQLTLGGCGFYRRGRRTELLPPGTALLDRIPGQFEYGYSADPTPQEYHFVFVCLHGPVAMRWMRRMHATFGRVLRLGDDRTVATQMLAMARQSEQPLRLDRYIASAQCYSLLMHLHSVLMRSRMQQATRASAATRLIDRHAGDKHFNVTRLAALLGCSREHLTRQFREATGLSPSTYLTQHRLRLAAHALRNDADKLDVIARRCGLSGANYLCRLFKDRYGLTPAQYRASPGTMML